MDPVSSNVERAILSQLDNPTSSLVRRVTEHNQILLHNFSVETPRTCTCALLGCPHSFRITLIPHQALYPKFCENHRSDHRRRHFVEGLTGGHGTVLTQIRVFASPG